MDFTMNKTSTKQTNKNITVKSSNDMTTDRRYGDRSNSTGSSNKGRDRSYKTIGTGYQDADDLLNSVLGEDETDRPKSKAATKDSGSGKPLHKLDRDSQRVGKAVRQLAVKSTAPSTTSDKQRGKPVRQIVDTTKPIEMCCDKIVLNAYMTPYELEAAVDRARQLVRDRRLVKSTSKQKHYRDVFKLPFESGTYAMFLMTPAMPKMKAQAQLLFNPNHSHMTEFDARSMVEIWLKLFGLNAKDIARGMLFHRVDICADFDRTIDDLIIDLDGVHVGTRFGVTTLKGGAIKSIYMGGPESKHHGLAYDQVASDKYKASVGEVTSRRRSLRGEAEIAFDATPQGLRIESRRLFKQPVGLAELGKLDNIFGGYKVWDVMPRPGIRMSPELVHYIDCVRLRGFNGARRWTLDNAADKKEAEALISENEKKLRRLAAHWWNPQDFNASLLAVLKKSPAWRFLRIMES